MRNQPKWSDLEDPEVIITRQGSGRFRATLTAWKMNRKREQVEYTVTLKDLCVAELECIANSAIEAIVAERTRVQRTLDSLRDKADE
jgi:hypothetical protein